MLLHKNSFAARRRAPARGFTLIEASLTTVIIGVGFIAMLQLIAAGTMTNVRGAEATTAMNLAKNVREKTLSMPFSQLITLNNVTYSPAIDSGGTAMTDFSTWSQAVTVEPVDPDRVTLTVADADPSAEHITVRIAHNGQTVSSVSWFAFDGTP